MLAVSFLATRGLFYIKMSKRTTLHKQRSRGSDNSFCFGIRSPVAASCSGTARLQQGRAVQSRKGALDNMRRAKEKAWRSII